MNENILNRKIILLRAGLTLVMVGGALGVTPQAITNEVNGRFKSRRIRKGLCELTNTTLDEFWPEFQEKKEDQLAAG